jgi:hypothetical protein
MVECVRLPDVPEKNSTPTPFIHRGAIVILLWGGDKRTQRRDIERAHELEEVL